MAATVQESNAAAFRRAGVDPAALQRLLAAQARSRRRDARRKAAREARRVTMPPVEAPSEVCPGPSALGNYFCTLDGEAVGNDYVLLDSCLESWPPLYSGERLTTMEILDWLWGLAKVHGYAIFAFYGAEYDFNNLLRDCDPDGWKWLTEGQYQLRLGPYEVRWMRGFCFQIYKVKGVSPKGATLYERIQPYYPDGRKRRDVIRMTIYDVLPFWQTRFEKALGQTLSEPQDMELIEWGKAKRGDFELADFVPGAQGRAYNKSELRNLAAMLLELDSWLAKIEIDTRGRYQGPGALAKAALQQHRVWVHSGRHFERKKGHSSSARPQVTHYMAPPGVLEAALSAYAAGRVEAWQVGRAPVAWLWDIKSAYPAETAKLPCLTHGSWEQARSFEPRSFGLWLIDYTASRELPSYPFFWRDKTSGNIAYPARCIRWAYTPEVVSAMKHDPAGLKVLGGWVWRPKRCSSPRPLGWVKAMFDARMEYAARGELGAVQAIKLILNSLYGSFCQARGGTPADPPWTQQILWAGWITAAVRAKLYDAAMLDPEATLLLSTDGLLTRRPLELPLSKALGGWGVEELHDLVIYQPGRYFATEQTKSRGFDSDSLGADQVLAAWRSKGVCAETGDDGKPCKKINPHVHITERRFHNLGLVAINHKPEEWCHWLEMPITLDVTGERPPTRLGGSPAQLAKIAAPRKPRLETISTTEQSWWFVKESRKHRRGWLSDCPWFKPSAPHVPNWTIKGPNAPDPSVSYLRKQVRREALGSGEIE